MEICLLGPMSVRTPTTRLTINSRQVRSLLAVLVLARGRVISPGSLMDGLWDDQGLKNRRNAMQATVSRLRRIMVGHPGATLGVGPGGYWLELDPTAVDVHRFSDLAARADQLGASDLRAPSGSTGKPSDSGTAPLRRPGRLTAAAQ